MKKAPTHRKRTGMAAYMRYRRRIPKVGWYNTARWQRLRKRQLRKEPLCYKCKEQGYTTEATVVDHIIPHKSNKALFFDSDNLASMCPPCHNTKTAKEDGGFGR